MTVTLTSTVIVLDTARRTAIPAAAPQCRSISAALNAILRALEMMLQSRRTALDCRRRVQTTRLQLADANLAPIAPATGFGHYPHSA